MIQIRSFRNTDVDAVCAVFNAHHKDLPGYHFLDGLRLELFCLAKPYFDPHSFWVAEWAGQVVGFLHHGPTAAPGLQDANLGAQAIFALCVAPHPEETDVALALIDWFMTRAAELGSTHVRYRPLLPDSAYYLGLGAADSLIGATSQEVRTCNWLSQAGFIPSSPTSMWELELMAFKAPIDRMQIQIRRTATVNQQLDEPDLPWWQACILGHTEPTLFQLMHRTEKRLLQQALFWSLAPELQTSRESVIWLWPPQEQPEPQQEDHLTFLLAEALRQFQSERVDVVRTPGVADSPSSPAVLRKLGFRPVFNGMVFAKSLATP